MCYAKLVNFADTTKRGDRLVDVGGCVDRWKMLSPGYMDQYLLAVPEPSHLLQPLALLEGRGGHPHESGQTVGTEGIETRVYEIGV